MSIPNSGGRGVVSTDLFMLWHFSPCEMPTPGEASYCHTTIEGVGQCFVINGIYHGAQNC